MSADETNNNALMLEVSAAAGGLAHELRNALSTLRMNLQLLDEDWGQFEAADDARQSDARRASDAIDLTRRGRKRVAILLSETRRLEAILEDFLQFVNRRRLNREPADLNHLASDVVEFFRPQAEASNISLDFAASDEPLIADVDINLVKQAVLNLLINAQQAMQDGGRLRIETSAPASTDGVIEVADNGPGIPPDRLHKVFDAYYSTKKAGTGLGLTMARQIIREHGGEITVRSDPGAGAVFAVRLPLTKR